jgi:hypothetical protein
MPEIAILFALITVSLIFLKAANFESLIWSQRSKVAWCSNLEGRGGGFSGLELMI